MHCANCGHKLEDAWTACPICGARVGGGADPRARGRGGSLPDQPDPRHPGRRVRDPRGARPRRDGHRLPGPRKGAGPRSGREGPAVFPRVRRRVRRAVPARGPHRGAARTSQHHPDLPGRPERPGHLLRDEAGAGRLAGHAAGGRRAAAAGRHPADPGGVGAGAQLRRGQGHRPPRHQARQHHVRRARRLGHHRLRHRQGGERPAADGHRDVHRHAALHEPGAGAGAGDRRPERHLLAGRGGVPGAAGRRCRTTGRIRSPSGTSTSWSRSRSRCSTRRTSGGSSQSSRR